MACYDQAGARKVYAVEASAMADYCVLLKDANPGALRSPQGRLICMHLAVPQWRLHHWTGMHLAGVKFQSPSIPCLARALSRLMWQLVRVMHFWRRVSTWAPQR